MTSPLPNAIDLHTTNDVVALRRLVLEQQQALAEHDALIAGRDRDIVYKDAKIAALTHEIARIKRWIYAARSEKLDPAQRALFDESLGEDIAALEVQLDALREPAPPPRNPPRREALPDHLPRIETRIEPESCQCAACGAALTVIGEDVTELLDCEPIRFFVRKRMRRV
jgi:hypothetical protein